MAKKKILIIEDEKQLVATIKMRLDAIGYEVDALYEGSKAIERIKTFLPDMVLLDIGLPGKDGRDILIELKKDEALKKIPVIIISGRDQQFERDYGLELGAIDYIIKPFSILLLTEKIQNLMKKQEKGELD